MTSRSVSVLIVEGDASAGRLLRGKVEQLGHSAVSVTNVGDAERHLQTEKPDIVVLDTGLPGSGSSPLLRSIHGSGAATAVIGMGARPDVDTVIHFMRFGAVDFLPKPVTAEDLEGAIERVLVRLEAEPTKSRPKRHAARFARGRPAPARETAAPRGRGRAPTPASKPPPVNRRSSRVATKEETKPAEPETPPTGREEDSLGQRIAITLDSLLEGRLPLPAGQADPAAVFGRLEDPECGLDDVVDVVSGDPAFAAEVLRVARTGRMGMATPLATLRDACLQIGNRKVSEIAQEVLVGRLHGVRSAGGSKIARRLWRNSLVTAAAVRDLAPAHGLDADEVYVAALLHNIGEVLILHALAEIRVAGGPDVSDPVAIERVCGLLHERVGARFLKGWNAPPRMVRLAEAHHDEPRRRESTTTVSLRHLVRDVWSVAVCRGWGYLPSHDSADLEDLALEIDEHRRSKLADAVKSAGAKLDR